MAKKRNRGGDGADNPRKRLRIVHETPTAEDVHNSRQLMQLLAFEQDLQKARHGLQSFKVFLDGLTNETGPKNEDVDILRDYLESTRPRHDDAEAMYLPDIMETWSYAAQMNNDNVMSAVPVVLALLLKFISQRLDLVPHGLGIGRTILQKRPQELIARNLATDKSKEFIISPTLRLLREALCLDGGALAKPIFRARSNTFKALARNMGIRFLGEGLEELKRPSARTTAVRFFLSAVKFLHLEAKVELLSQREIGPALTKHLRDDPPYLIFEILDTLKNHVLKDDKLPGNIKGKLLNSGTLSRIASLYNYEHTVTEEEGKTSVEDAVHSFLVFACTTPNAGILRPQSGFYPRGVDPDAPLLIESETADEQGLDTVSWMNLFIEDVPVRNMSLLDFIQQLRPWSNMKHSELIIAIFEAAPELVCPYFLAKKSFTFEPKLSATWIGYAAFIFNTVQLPIPTAFGNRSGYARIPPPTSVMIDNIIPLPLNQKVLRRCLTQQSDLIPFFATRLLVVSLQKLQAVLRLHDEARASGSSQNLWAESAQKLVNEFCQRTPDIKDIFNVYRGIPEIDLLQREAASRALRLYYEVIPQIALSAKFDISPLLIAAIARLGQFEDNPQDHALVLVELENVLAIAGYSPGMKWFSKSDVLSLSPYTALLKVILDAPEGVALHQLREVLGTVAEETQLVLPQKGRGSLNALLDGLQRTKQSSKESLPSELWAFLDNCTTRCAGSPIKYLEMMEDTVPSAKTKKSRATSSAVSPLVLTILEQLPFVKASASDETLVTIARFIAAYLSFLKQAGEDKRSLKAILEKIVTVFPEKHAARKLLKLSVEGPAQQNLESWGADFSAGEASGASQTSTNDDEGMSDESLEGHLLIPIPDVDNSVLSKWASKEADELIEEGYASSLITLLGSEHVSIRKEALISLLKIAAKVQESAYEEKEQVWLLLSELAETSRPQVDTAPLPGPIIAFATHALEIVKNPLHCLYGKVNTFLTRGPVWALDRFPLVHDIVQGGPEADDAYYTELGWLLSCLLGGLRSPADVALFHKRRLFERLLSLASNPYIRDHLKLEILKILFRTTCVEGGSTTLVTRFGIVSWLEAQAAKPNSGADAGMHKALLRRIWQTCDQERVSTWSKQGFSGDSGESAAKA
ncbi:putative ribosome biogenesis protein urb1 protein [Phaeoacremonium minimum UCRPA7]|uniref:Putative ribosome biogenesis protein urb1 protein n=1 Tax=Phaeoacremonium minimum (strain UCR-PA7) TaxID=1286976 RepID=R8BI26_PHAM7|nr:putative ribosome biogenesis protein urb1 protein [Phaeoacremonium minimum UCRPA7]EON98924.1 putative ribosome biogenesis protein urb1 protein [Phaeoacremonium minimum UCRPA7]